jgi:Fur family ferric uptake transcriptional regulator
MNDQQEELAKYIKKMGGRLTPSRLLILKEIYRRHDHFDAEALCSELQKTHKSVSLASIYRTLPLLLDAGLIREIKTNNKKKLYEHVLGHHHHEHMICEECGKIIEFGDNPLERNIHQICERKRFLPKSHQIIITGICKECG